MEHLSCAVGEPGEETTQAHAPATGQSTLTRAGCTRRRPAWLFPALTLMLITLGQEALFRGLFPLPQITGFNRISYQMMAQGHPRMRRMMARGLVYDNLLVESQPDGFSEIHHLNGNGFRGPDFAIDPSPGQRRILVIGDSVAEGMGAPESASINCQLERLLNADGERAEVINLGVIAASLAHDTILTRDAVALLHPADVVVVLYCNDLPAAEYEAGFDNPALAFSPSIQPWWKPRVMSLLERYIHDRPICLRWPFSSIRFFAPVPDSANPLSGLSGPPPGLDSALYQAMIAGKLNPFLSGQSTDIPRQLAHDFTKKGSPEHHLRRMQAVCEAVGVAD